MWQAFVTISVVVVSTCALFLLLRSNPKTPDARGQPSSAGSLEPYPAAAEAAEVNFRG